MFENANIETLDQMVEDAMKDKIFDDVCEELEYQFGYVRGATDMLERVKTLIKGFGGLTASQEQLCQTIMQWIGSITYRDEPIVSVESNE